MPTYITNEAQFDIGEGWEDQSIIGFSSPGAAPKSGLVVTKQRLAAGEKVDDVIDKHLRSTSQKLRRFELLESKERTVGGIKAREARFTFSHDGAALYERQVFVQLGDLVWVLTASAIDAKRADVDQAAEKLLASVKFRRPTSG
jgi:hypothetical protein